MTFIIRVCCFLNLRIYSLIKYIYYWFIPSIKVGRNLLVERNVTLNVMYGGTITLGDYCELRRGSQLLSYGGNIIVGHHSSINPYTVVYGQGNIRIGNYVRIAAHCTLIPSNHVFADYSKPICEQGLINRGIVIEDDVWIGTGVRILDGVVVSTGCVVGAGSVVTHSTEPYGIYVGVPAKKIKSRV